MISMNALKVPWQVSKKRHAFGLAADLDAWNQLPVTRTTKLLNRLINPFPIKKFALKSQNNFRLSQEIRSYGCIAHTSTDIRKEDGGSENNDKSQNFD